MLIEVITECPHGITTVSIGLSKQTLHKSLSSSSTGTFFLVLETSGEEQVSIQIRDVMFIKLTW